MTKLNSKKKVALPPTWRRSYEQTLLGDKVISFADKRKDD